MKKCEKCEEKNNELIVCKVTLCIMYEIMIDKGVIKGVEGIKATFQVIDDIKKEVGKDYDDIKKELWKMIAMRCV